MNLLPMFEANLWVVSKAETCLGQRLAHDVKTRRPVAIAHCHSHAVYFFSIPGFYGEMSILNKRCCHFRVLVSGFMYVSILSKSEQMNFSVSLVLQCTKSTNTYIHLYIQTADSIAVKLDVKLKGAAISLSDCKWH